jgi:hypothetical protein
MPHRFRANIIPLYFTQMYTQLLRHLTTVLALSCMWCVAGCGSGDGNPEDSSIPENQCVLPKVACGDTCSDTRSDPAHCGNCQTVCGAGSACWQGICGSCPATLLTCGGSCVDPNTDSNHCGSCGSACGLGQVCEGAKCVVRCDAPLLRCGDRCIDPTTDAGNCGNCGTSCNPGEVCSLGSCQCPTGREVCGTSCVDLKADPMHCGSCESRCGSGEVCNLGTCECPSGRQMCGTSCIDLNADPMHCGSCGNPCAIDRACEAGQCKCPAATPNECTGECISFDSDPMHCGNCDTQCESFESCQSGSCKYDADGCGGAPEGINLVRVALYQAVEVDLFRDGKTLAPGDRSAHVIQNRDALLRGFVQVPSGSERRDISMRIVVRNGDQTEVLFQRRTVAGTSVQADIGSTFVVELPARLIGKDTTVSLNLAACDVNGSTGKADMAHLPPDGSAIALAAMKTGRIKLAFVPLIHEGITPSITEAAIAPYVDEVLQQYPVEGVDVTTLTPIDSGFSGPRPNFARVLDETIFPKRQADAPSLDTYYYGLIRPTVKFGEYCVDTCTAGIGYVTSTVGQDAADYRIALGVAYDDPMSWEVLPHELGHNHGREHAPCAVPDGDPAYPYAGASIGSWGYERATAELISPNTHVDFMSYCTPTWISNYTFEALAQRVARVNMSSLTEQLRIGAPRLWWSILTTPDGQRWSHPRTTWDAVGVPTAGRVYDADMNPISEVELARIHLSEGGGSVLLVPPPLPGWFAVGAVGEVPLPYPPQ